MKRAPSSTNPRPYIAPAFQAAHLAGLGVGEKALIVEVRF
jgi:hypothetical protein